MPGITPEMTFAQLSFGLLAVNSAGSVSYRTAPGCHAHAGAPSFSLAPGLLIRGAITSTCSHLPVVVLALHVCKVFCRRTEQQRQET